MAMSKYEYVKDFEVPDPLLPNTWIVVRVDGRGFHKFTDAHRFQKPNDVRALNLMNHTARAVMEEFEDIVLAYGESDEFSFVLHKDTPLFNRRSSKISTSIASYFTAVYVMSWPRFMVDAETKEALALLYPPQFDARCVCYPSLLNLRDYLSWRQADCHINNLYNTAFWALVLRGKCTEREAGTRLNATVSAQKNEILFSEFGINYNNEPPMFRKGSTLLREPALAAAEGAGSAPKWTINEHYIDMIGDEFHEKYAYLFAADMLRSKDQQQPVSKRQQEKLEKKAKKAEARKAYKSKEGPGAKGAEAAVPTNKDPARESGTEEGESTDASQSQKGKGVLYGII